MVHLRGFRKEMKDIFVTSAYVRKVGKTDFFPPFAFIPGERWSLAGVSLQLRRMMEKDTVTFLKEKQHLQMP